MVTDCVLTNASMTYIEVSKLLLQQVVRWFIFCAFPLFQDLPEFVG